MNQNQKLNQHFIININGVEYVYVYIRKNACSAWKRVFFSESEYQSDEDKNLRPIEFMNKFHRAATIEKVMAVENRIVILRDPLVRVYSAFINQIVMRFNRQYAVHKAIQNACGKPIGDVTFFEFVSEYLLKVDLNELDGHFRPQYLSLLPIKYQHVWDISKLHQQVANLLGENFANKYFLRKVNSTERIIKYPLPSKDMTIRQIFGIWNDREILPDFDSLIAAEFRSQLAAFYEKDVILINSNIKLNAN